MKKEKENEKSAKPKYNMWQCSAYMILLAWREKEKKVLLLCLLQVFLAVMSNLVNLYVSPSVLSVVERRASMTELLTTVLVFVILIMFCFAATSYVNSNTLYGRVTVRLALISTINKKACTTSHSNLADEKFIKLGANANKPQVTIGKRRKPFGKRLHHWRKTALDLLFICFCWYQRIYG